MSFVSAAVAIKDVPPKTQEDIAKIFARPGTPFELFDRESLARLWEKCKRDMQIAAEKGGMFTITWGPKIENLKAEIDSFDAGVMAHFKRCPDDVHKLTGHQFSALVAAILKDQGCDVQLGPKTRDGGRDILAAFKTPHMGKVVTLVECKRWNPERKVGVDILRGFLYVMRNSPTGMIATSSSFSEDALKIAQEKEHQTRLSLKDFECIREWLTQYGHWAHKDDSGLWLPKASKTCN